MNDEGQTVLDLANDLPENSDKAAILQLLQDAIDHWAENFTEDQIATSLTGSDQRKEI